MSDERPPRKAIPTKVRKIVIQRQRGACVCGCGKTVSWQTNTDTHMDHEPALRLRDVLPDGSDYSPAQNDPTYIDARCAESHRIKTSGSGATIAGTDIGKIKKERARSRAPRFRRPMKSRGFDKTKTRGFDGRVRDRT